MKSLLLLPLVWVTLHADIALPENFESHFEQTITNDKGKTLHYTGSVIYRYNKHILIDDQGAERAIANSLFKWNYQTPTQKEVCSDGVQITIIDHDLEQVSKYLIDEGVDLEQILKRAEMITLKDYKATYKEVEYLITLDEQQQLNKIVYVDNLDNTVKIKFETMKYNLKSFDDAKLECPMNPDYDVIEG